MSELKPVAKVSSGGYVNGQAFRMYNIKPIRGLESDIKVGQFLFAIPEGYTLISDDVLDSYKSLFISSEQLLGFKESKAALCVLEQAVDNCKAMTEASKAGD